MSSLESLEEIEDKREIQWEQKINVVREKSIKNFIKCTFCGRSDRVEYLGGLDWFCNKRCHYKFRHMKDNS